MAWRDESNLVFKLPSLSCRLWVNLAQRCSRMEETWKERQGGEGGGGELDCVLKRAQGKNEGKLARDQMT